MHDTVPMRFLQTVGNLHRDFQRFGRRQRSTLQPFRECLPL